MNTLKVAIFQLNLVWENIASNMQKIEDLAYSISENIDLIVLPEMFTTGFSMNAKKHAETMDGKTIGRIKKIAKDLNCTIAGSIIIKEDEVFRNRFIWIGPKNKCLTYDKRHSFSLLEEETVYTSGNKKTLIEYQNWKVSPFICYDLRFPVWCREFGRRNASNICS